MIYKINDLEVSKDVSIITYSRVPTSTEIKLGYGAIHYRDFEIAELEGNLSNTIFKVTLIETKTGLRYSFEIK